MKRSQVLSQRIRKKVAKTAPKIGAPRVHAERCEPL